MSPMRVLWIEDQYEDLTDWEKPIYDAGYLLDNVGDATTALDLLPRWEWHAVIFDIKINPGDDPEWKTLDLRRRKENPHFDPYLGLELLRFVLGKNCAISKAPTVTIEPGRIVVLSVVTDESVLSELEGYGIPSQQILSKSSWDMSTLPNVLKRIESEP
jgi:hypothetical protein